MFEVELDQGKIHFLVLKRSEHPNGNLGAVRGAESVRRFTISPIIANYRSDFFFLQRLLIGKVSHGHLAQHKVPFYRLNLSLHASLLHSVTTSVDHSQHHQLVLKTDFPGGHRVCVASLRPNSKRTFGQSELL